MSIRIASILISVLAHGTAYLYLDDFISLDRPALSERGQGMKITLVRAEKSTPSQPRSPVTVPESVETITEVTATPPPEERMVETQQMELSGDLEVLSDVLIRQINKQPPTAADKPIKVAAKTPSPAMKRLPNKKTAERKPDLKPVTPEPEQRVTQASLVASVEHRATPIEGVIAQAQPDQTDQLLAIEQAYADALAAAIEKHKHYPLRARKKGQEGEVKVLFTILQDGTIAQVQIGESSMSSVLDRAASRAVEQLGRFQPIPQQLGRKRWDFSVPIRFAMN